MQDAANGNQKNDDLVELDQNGEPMLSPIEEDLDEEFKTTAYANNAFAFNEEKLQRDSVAATSVDVRSTDIEDDSMVSQSTSSLMPPLSRQSSSLSVQSRRSSVLVDVSLLEGPYEQLVKR